MAEATIEDLAFSSRPRGKAALPVGRECLSMEGIRKEALILRKRTMYVSNDPVGRGFPL